MEKKPIQNSEAWQTDPRRASIESLESEQPCEHCGEIIPPGDRAIKETRRRNEPGSNLPKKERTFAYYHPRYVPKTETESEPGQDIYTRGRRLGGSFEGGKRK